MIQIFNGTVPDFLVRDDEILWHGTSNVSEGFLDKMHPVPFAWFSKEELKKIISIYHKIGWAGIHGGGFAVLDTFSLYDFEDDIKKNIYLGETVQRAKLYASADFAGGELVRSIYYSIKDLIRYSSEPDIREKNADYIERENEFNFIKKSVYLEDISNDLIALSDIMKKATEIRSAFKTGIIYGYKILRHDYNKLLYRGGMGILLKESLDPATKVYKVVLIKDEQFNEFTQDKDRFSRTVIWQKRIKSDH